MHSPVCYHHQEQKNKIIKTEFLKSTQTQSPAVYVQGCSLPLCHREARDYLGEATSWALFLQPQASEELILTAVAEVPGAKCSGIPTP
jgi:hypothetical protein